MNGRYLRLAATKALLVTGLGAAALPPAMAQSAGQDIEQPTEQGALNLPNNVQILAHTDPAVRKATAIVNGTIITDTDIDQRLALVLAANKGNVTAEERQRLRLQVLSNLIDETLQIQEAAASKVTIDRKDIDQAYNRVATNFKKTPADFAGYLKSIGSSSNSMRRQIEGELAWRRLLDREVEPFVSVSDDEVKAVLARLQASKGASEYHVGEIYLSATPANQGQVEANANRIVEQIRGGGVSFAAYAREYSEASTKAVGGDLGWVRAEQLPDALSGVIQQMPTNSISNPIPVNGGYSILALIDQRKVLSSDPRDTTLALKQISLPIPKNASKAQMQPKVSAFSDALKTLQGCGKADDLGKQFGAEVVENDQVRVGDLPPQLQPIMLNLRVGEATPPFGSSDEGTIRALVVCGRDEPAAQGLPSFDQIQSQMEDERVNLRAHRYLRDIRRDAVIDYR